LLENTFVHVPGIGAPMERALWDRGCMTWSDALTGINDLPFGAASRDIVRMVLNKSVEALETKEHQFFSKALGTANAWRAWPSFRSECVYLDIETDGGQSGDSITTVGIYDGNEFEVFVKGQNIESFRDRISDFGMIVTFFGLGFDIPMIRKRYPNLSLDHIHLDLCPTLRDVGIKGGLKKIEKELGIARGEETDGLSGRDAITLWRRFDRFKDDKALETLIAYNREDVVNLETLAQIAFDKKKEALFGVKPEA
jgi:uncharacterized protein YprB with RNaseH-like and TPR domain